MDRWVGKVAVVTGASAGIGQVLARRLTELGLQVVGLARRVEKIEDLAQELEAAPGKLYALKCDMAQEEDILNAFQWIKENLGDIYILINNAGVMLPASFVESTTEQWKQMMNVNVLGLAIATREFLKDALDKNIEGHIVNINSLAGLYVPNTGISFMNLYPSSKHALTALNEVVRQELIQKKSRVKITGIHPGGVETEMSASVSNSGLFGEVIQPDDSGMALLKPEDVVDSIIYALGTPPDVQIQQIIIRPRIDPY